MDLTFTPIESPLASHREPKDSARPDLLPLITTLRWGFAAIGLVLTGADLGDLGAGIAVSATLAVSLTLFRTLRAIDPAAPANVFQRQVVLDLTVLVAGILISSGWDSPFALTPVPVLFLIAYRGGYVPGLSSAAATTLVVTVPQLVTGASADSLRLGAQGALVYLVTAAVGGFSRSSLADLEARERAVVDERERMAAAHDLLLALHRVVQTLPESLDLGEVIASTRQRLRASFDYTSATIVVRDESTASWRVELADGVRLPATIPPDRLPWDLAQASLTTTPGFVNDLLSGNRAGCSPFARSALYAPLRTRDDLVGLIAIEHTDPGRFSPRDADLLAGLADPLALALDNARWFGRLRILGAEAERARIARDLHDRFAQSLAYVTFELERVGRAADADPSLLDLREYVRSVLTELRETLADLRATIDEETDLASALREHTTQFQDRTGIEVVFVDDRDGARLPVQVEQELWRIAQEALTNVARHSRATHVEIRWIVDTDRAALVISDDGCGFAPASVGRDRFGLVGMRERADAVGARLSISSRASGGTRVLVEAPRS